jgi:cell wall-associated NlpC family hydrolase
MIGVQLPRDAHQQAVEGHAVEFDEIEFGDCIFLDTSAAPEELHAARDRLEVTHVVLSVGAQDFLHASQSYGMVLRGSFDPHSPWYVESFRDRFLGARRYI